MTKGTPFPAAANPPGRSIAHYLEAARRQHDEITAKFTEAERGYHEAVNALPLPELMQGPVVRATDLTPIAEIEKVLGMTQGEDEKARLIKELRDFRQRRDILAGQFAVATFGDQLVAAAAWRIAFDAYEAAAAPLRQIGLSEDRIDALADAEGDALTALYLAPAPDLEAVAAKLALLAASAASAENVVLSAVLDDILRLAELEPSPECGTDEGRAIFDEVDIVPMGTADEMKRIVERFGKHRPEFAAVCAIVAMDRPGIETFIGSVLAEPAAEAEVINLLDSLVDLEKALKLYEEITRKAIARIIVVGEPFLDKLQAEQNARPATEGGL